MQFAIGVEKASSHSLSVYGKSRDGKAIFSRVFFAFSLALISVFLGLVATFIHWKIVISIFGLPLVLLFGFFFPLFAFVVALMFLFGVVPEAIVAALPLGKASLRPAELILIFLFFTVLFKARAGGTNILKPMRVYIPLLILLGLGIVLGFLKGKLFSHNALAMSDARQYVGWLALPISIWFLQKKPIAFERAIICLAIFSAVLMVLQLVFGVQLIYGFRGAEEISKEFSGVTRSAIGGGLFVLVYAAYRLFFRACNETRHRFLLVFGAFILAGGVVASFNRAIWAGFFVLSLVLVFFKPKVKVGTLAPILYFLIFSLVSLCAVSVVKPGVVDAIVGRAFSVQSEGGKGSSLGFRFDENTQALAALRKDPILGVGFGGEYKRVFRQFGVGGGFDIETSYIHNGYLSLWLKLGAFGLLFPIVLLFVVFRRYKGTKFEVAGEAASKKFCAFLVILLFFISSLTSPDWTTLGQLTSLSIMLAILAVRDPVS